MPIISRFFGIVAPPHFHARYQDQEVAIEIDSGLVEGKMSRRALRMLLEWSEKHQEELMRNWELAQAGKPLELVPPLT